MASSKRERELARLRAERQAARRAAAAARRRQRNAIVATVVVFLLVAGGLAFLTADLHHSTTKTASAAPSASPTPTPTPQPTNPPGRCTYNRTAVRSPRIDDLPPATPDLAHTYTVKMVTNRGEIDFDTLTAKAPCTTNNIRSLAHFKFFDRTPCHRLVTSVPYVLQCGDPLGSGSGGPGYSFPDENLAGARYARGTVAMANSGPGTNGSQFFIIYKDSLTLPPNYTPFGIVTKGLDVLDKIAAAGVVPRNGPNDGSPKLPVEIETLRVAPKAG